MGTAMTITAGKAPEDGKTLTFEGKMDDPMKGKLDNSCRFIDRVVSKDEIHQEIHGLSPGKDFPASVIPPDKTRGDFPSHFCRIPINKGQLLRRRRCLFAESCISMTRIGALKRM